MRIFSFAGALLRVKKASRLSAGCPESDFNAQQALSFGYIRRSRAFAALFHLEINPVTLIQRFEAGHGDG
ncbi:hypothetical protein DENIS_2146 [Desulfonema ishimotonii]|uniref:Uncharacterized protein n=1 Tax=Desulfonema ishimotonii TaxID=45657 RepID=A0A401FW43_9BACT|nr:hypothetical protein DENIS_2146 [Desulfonema ishimotonii]